MGQYPVSFAMRVSIKIRKWGWYLPAGYNYSRACLLYRMFYLLFRFILSDRNYRSMLFWRNYLQ